MQCVSCRSRAKRDVRRDMCGEEVGVNKLDVRRDKETARATDDHKTPYSASFDSANNRFAPTDEVIEQFRIVPARIECGADRIVVFHGQTGRASSRERMWQAVK